MKQVKLYDLIMVFGILSLIYYIILKLCTFNMAFAEFWLFISMGSFILYWAMKNRLIPQGIGKIIIIIIVMGLMIFITLESIIIYTGSIEDKDQTNYVLVLGAGIDGDKVSRTLKLRLDKAIEFNREFEDIPIIVSGGMGEGETITEALAMKNYLVDNGVHDKNILMEDKSTSTYENFKFSKAIMEEGQSLKIGEESLVNLDKDISITLITNSFHMFRAKYIGEGEGLEIHCFNAPTEKVTALNFYVRESFALIKDVLFRYIK
ncbi:YdcF family protein [Clostridium sp.]|uniref:YdcF family protein n=1 Tax=Clostridium sp. TaxID=1506 RepID=UPI00321725DD